MKSVKETAVHIFTIDQELQKINEKISTLSQSREALVEKRADACVALRQAVAPVCDEMQQPVISFTIEADMKTLCCTATASGTIRFSRMVP